ncbi:diacylglycerol kinase [Candidatus Mycoplasma mahonii]|uniref:diacylglycerol kinase n=1 Tax=Candidatus Mycoplasma mahonii TaxID=3004105 RepID=UPI0026EE31E4|nr:diacylglycerol kinase family protein [Candidatus Mycoplasma mahonii]WKX02787.1 diacylglycerol kinase family protein [Candidatus Mycoplasma mahonii]
MFKVLKKIKKKFFYSFVGLWITAKEEKSMLVYLFIYSIFIGLGIWLKLNITEWAIVIMVMFIVLTVEILNTAVEATVDSVSFQYNVKVKKIKDIASGATLVITTGMFVTFCIIYIPKLMEAL